MIQKKSKKLTHEAQVLKAIKKIKKGTFKEIYQTIPDVEKWGNSQNAVRSHIFTLSRKNKIRKDNKNPKMWAYGGKKISTVKKTVDNISENNLYLLTVNDCIKPPFAGLPFKVGKCKSKLKNRLKGYNQSLPFDTIRFICNYTIQLPKSVSLDKVDTQVQNEIKKLTKNDHLGFGIIKLHGGNQTEWFTAKKLRPDNKEHIDKLAMAIEKIIDDIIIKLLKS